MKKYTNSIFSGLIYIGFMSVDNAVAGDNTISIGYAQTESRLLKYNVDHIKDYIYPVGFFSDYKDQKGINIKFRHELNDKLGVISSLTYTSKFLNGNAKIQDRYGEFSTRGKYLSFIVGPTFRLNEYVSAYATAGIARTKVRNYSANYSIKQDAQGKDTYTLTDSDTFSDRKTSFTYGVGLQFNPIEPVAIDVSYERSGHGVWRASGLNIGVGYRF
ncbi:Ail/Lom family outer membrane beta-barrel protein [Yersinia wautersii]|uniref:Attachment invasion locus protein n=1 Tax=Yersinia wautersii TaxID=1341643 RepID=A0ABM9TJT2_9GAMM|nr:Ail/Lom family outer membrane beta-barrel protein [Yersinia wautersii]CRG52221.1 attachment invasion locus protein [Yersinia wautersii]